MTTISNIIGKKILAIMVLAVFVLSIVPIALAQPGSGKNEPGDWGQKFGPKFKELKLDNQNNGLDDEPEAEDQAKTEDEAEAEDQAEDETEDNGGADETENDSEEDPNLSEDEMGEAKQFPKGLIERHRRANKKFLEVKEKHLEAKKRLIEQRRELVQLKGKATACKEEDVECQEEKKQLLSGTQKHLVKIGQVMERSLEKLLNRVENSKVLTEAEKEEVSAKISALEDKIKAKIKEIEDLSKGEIGAAELRLKIKELKELWQEVSREQRWIVTQMINHKMENVVEKHLEYVNGMEMRIADLEKKGAAPEKIEALKEKLEDFKEEVGVLRDDYAAAEKAWAEAKGDVTRGAFIEAKEKQQEVREQLKVTKQLLREFMVMYKEAYKATVNGTDDELPPVSEGSSPVSEGASPVSEGSSPVSEVSASE